MSDAPHTQSVVILVTDGEKRARFERAIENNWPGRANPSIQSLIRETADLLIAQIDEAEGQAS